MKLDRILCPIDYSDFSTAANFYATFLAASTQAEIIYLHVVFPEYFAAGVDSESEACLRDLQKIRPFDSNVGCRHVVRHGHPAKEILNVAHELQVDLIAMGTHGRGAVGKLLYGSVATAVHRNAECPVLAIRLPSKNA